MNPIVESVATSEDVGQQNPKKELHPTWKSILIVALVFSVLWLFVSFGLFILIISIAKGALLILFLIPIIIASIHILNICLIAKNLKSNEVIYLSGLPILWFFTLSIPGVILAIVTWVKMEEIKTYQNRQD